MSKIETEAYAKGFKIGWDKCEEHILKLISEAPDVDYVGEWLKMQITPTAQNDKENSKTYFIDDSGNAQNNNQKQNVQEGVSNSDTLRTTQTASSDNQKLISEDRGNTSPSPPLRKKRQPIEGGCIGDSLAPSDAPQECSRQANVAAKEDNGDCTLPADLKLFQKAADLVMLEDKELLEELGKK